MAPSPTAQRRKDMEKLLRNAAQDTWANAKSCASARGSLNSKKNTERIYRAIMAYGELRAVELMQQKEPHIQLRARIAKLEGRLKELREARGY